MKTRKLSGAMGAEVSEVDLSTSVDADTLRAIERAFHEHIVLVFRGQSLSPERQVAFTEHFGAVEEHPLRTRRSVAGFPGVLVLENRPGKRGATNDYWHSDISHAECPPALSVLHALEVPTGRGDTQFCNMYAAYEALSPGLRRALDGLEALHSGEASLRRAQAQTGSDALLIEKVPPPQTHPVVRTHPKTGRKALYLNPHFTLRFEDMSAEESAPLMRYLFDFATRPENVYRHRWAPGDVLMWDNRCAMHYAVYDYDETTPRLMHRTTAAGDRPF